MKNMFKIFVLFFCFNDLIFCKETTTLDYNGENTDTTTIPAENITETSEITENTTDKNTENVTKSNNSENSKETTVLPTTTMDPILEICNSQNAVRRIISLIFKIFSSKYLILVRIFFWYYIALLLCCKSMLLSP